MFRFNLFRNQKTNDLLRVICCIISKKIDNKIIPPVPVASMPTCANTHTDTHTHTHTHTHTGPSKVYYSRKITYSVPLSLELEDKPLRILHHWSHSTYMQKKFKG